MVAFPLYVRRQNLGRNIKIFVTVAEL